MKTYPAYSLFGYPVSRRLFLWSLVLCPAFALAVWLSSRSRGMPGDLRLHRAAPAQPA